MALREVAFFLVASGLGRGRVRPLHLNITLIRQLEFVVLLYVQMKTFDGTRRSWRVRLVSDGFVHDTLMAGVKVKA